MDNPHPVQPVLTPFPKLVFQGELRPSQREVVELARQKLASGAERRLHIAAPPGAGKTVLGLYIWAEVVKRPALVLSPNSAIQAQWAARIDLFQDHARLAEVVSTDAEQPAFLTALTYQAVTLPGRHHEALDPLTQVLWAERLIEQGEVASPEEAARWIGDLAAHNPAYYQQRLAVYRREARQALTHTVLIRFTTHPQRASPPRELELAPASAAKFVICDYTIEHVNSSVKRCRIVKDRLRLWKQGIRDLVMELCCALHNFRVRLVSLTYHLRDKKVSLRWCMSDVPGR